jgi:cytosine/uracil/thiamine/allantoin permease
MLADYLIVRKRTLKIESLYIGNSRSIYWYQGGFHWRAALAWVLGTWPTMPGFVMTLRDPVSASNWANLFKIAFLVGESENAILRDVVYISCAKVSRYLSSHSLSYANCRPLLILVKAWTTL